MIIMQPQSFTCQQCGQEQTALLRSTGIVLIQPGIKTALDIVTEKENNYSITPDQETIEQDKIDAFIMSKDMEEMKALLYKKMIEQLLFNPEKMEPPQHINCPSTFIPTGKADKPVEKDKFTWLPKLGYSCYNFHQSLARGPVWYWRDASPELYAIKQLELLLRYDNPELGYLVDKQLAEFKELPMGQYQQVLKKRKQLMDKKLRRLTPAGPLDYWIGGVET